MRIVLAVASIVLAFPRVAAGAQGVPNELVERVYTALALVTNQRWEEALDLGRDALADAERELESRADSGRAGDVAPYLARAVWAVARAEHALGQPLEAMRHLAEREAAEIPFDDQSRSLLLSLHGAILVELGLPDLARDPLARAMRLCNEKVVDGLERDYGAFFDANLGEVRRSLSIGAFREALDALAATETRFSWENATEKMKPPRANARRAQIEVLRATANAGAGYQDAPTRTAAREGFVRALAIEDAYPQDHFTAAAGLLELDLAARRLDLAAEDLERIDRWRAEEKLPPVSVEDEAWLAALRARLARAQGKEAESSRPMLRTALATLLDDWRSVDRPGGVGFLRFDRPRMLLVELMSNASADDALAVALEAQEFGVLWRALERPSPTPAQVREALCAEGTGCLVYVSGTAESLLLAFDRSEARTFPLPRYHWIEERVRELRGALAATGLRTERQERILRDVPQQLAGELVPAGVRDLLARWKHVRIVGRDALAGVNFQCLPVLEGRPLGATHALSDLPSLAVGWALARRRSSSAGRRPNVVVIGAPAPDRGVQERHPELRNAALTAAGLASLLESLPKETASVRVDADATFGALASARASSDIVQVVAHGVLDPLRELRPMIVLTPDARAADGLVTVERARTISAPDLVILSVCRAADGVERLGDAGSSDLGGAFLQAGASSVVVADQELRLSDALVVTRILHTRLREHDTVAEALRCAYAELEQRFPNRSTWGLPYVFGLGQ